MVTLVEAGLGLDLGATGLIVLGVVLLVAEAMVYERQLRRAGSARPKVGSAAATAGTAVASVAIAYVSYFALLYISVATCTGYCD